MFYELFVRFESKTEKQLYARCPLHNDSNASFTVNEDTHEWYCHGCGFGGTEVEFIEHYYDVPKKVAQQVFLRWEKSKYICFPTDEYVKGCHEALMRKPKEIEVLNGFGITQETIDKFMLGWDDCRITIPIKSKTGLYVNVRKYLPPHRRIAGGNNAKVVNIRNLGSNRYFPYEAFDESQEIIYVLEGEKDCLAARSQGLNAVTSTGGTNIPLDEVFLFKGKIVYLCLDSDPAGSRITKQYQQLLKPYAKEIHVIRLPVKDFSDYWVEFEDAEITKYCVATVEDPEQLEGPDSTTLSKSEYVENLNSWIKLENMSVVGADPKTYTIPCKLKVLCKDVHCNRPCAVGASATPVEVDVDSRQLLQFVDAPDSVQDSYLRKMFGCKSIQAVPAEYVNVQKILFQESAAFVDGLEDSTFENRYGIFLYEEARLIPTVRYDFNTSRVTDPRTQQNYYVINKAQAVTQYVESDNLRNIQFFRSIAGSCNNVHELIEKHYKLWGGLLGIEGRPDLFGAIILTYLSVTEIQWGGGIIKGWLDSMVIGDTRTGKSQMAQRFVKHVQMGSYINGENARRTGVIGGVQKMGDSWVITWGAIPMNDKGLLIIDEASGLSIDDIKELSATRSSGAVTINKITKGEAKARTRLLWLSNPRSGRNLEDFYWKGYGAFREYIPVVEDQARYDLVMTAAREDVETLEGNLSTASVDVENYRELINFAWNVSCDRIIFFKGVEDVVRETAKQLDKDYGGGPLVVGVAVHEKILRLSVALALLCGEIENGCVHVSEKHVKMADEFLRSTYDKPSLDYKGYIREVQKAARKKAENTKFIRALCVAHPALKVLLASNSFRGNQVREILGIDSLEASKLVSELLQRGLLKISGSGAYSPDKLLIDMAKQMEVDV